MVTIILIVGFDGIFTVCLGPNSGSRSLQSGRRRGRAQAVGRDVAAKRKEQETMTLERAIEILDPTRKVQYRDLFDGMEQIEEARRMGMEALKKRHPKRPVFKTGEMLAYAERVNGEGEAKIHKWADWVCPECGWFVGEQYLPRRRNQQKSAFCAKCGQAIGWTEAEQSETYR